MTLARTFPSVESVVPPPDFNSLSWHQVRTYIEEGYAAGKQDPYPRNYSPHLRWVSEAEQARIDAARDMQPLPIKQFEDENISDKLLFGEVKKEPIESDESLPDSDDSFWMPVAGRYPISHDDGPAVIDGVSSSRCPPAHLVKDEEVEEERDEMSCCSGDRDPFVMPPSQSRIEDVRVESMSGASSEPEQLMQEAEPLSQPPVPETFLGVEAFVPEDMDEEGVMELDADYERELEQELLEALMMKSEQESD